MKLHTVFVTFNRLELTKQAIESYLETVTAECSLALVDNGSSDGTREWFAAETCGVDMAYHFMDENRYPGFATNVGWKHAPPRATHLHRADNDFAFLPGWCDEVERCFSENDRLGQLGLRTDEEELHAKSNVGGNCVIRRELWDKGLRWDERPWPQLAQDYGAGYTEDSIMSHQVKRYGWGWDRVDRPCIQSLSIEDPADPYYLKSWEDRGILENAKKAYGVT